jgi:hypothetical protein
MPSISAFLRSLGNVGALTNVRTVLEMHAREDWLIAGLAVRLDERDRAPGAGLSAAPDVAPGVLAA